MTATRAETIMPILCSKGPTMTMLTQKIAAKMIGAVSQKKIRWVDRLIPNEDTNIIPNPRLKAAVSQPCPKENAFLERMHSIYS